MSADNWRLQETYKSLPTLAAAGIRTIILLNGGALIAVLAFLGQVWGRIDLDCIVYPASLFVFGTGFGAGCTILAYVTQLRLLNELDGNRESRLPGHTVLLHFTLGLAGIALLCFLVGGAWIIFSFPRSQP